MEIYVGAPIEYESERRTLKQIERLAYHTAGRAGENRPGGGNEPADSARHVEHRAYGRAAAGRDPPGNPTGTPAACSRTLESKA